MIDLHSHVLPGLDDGPGDVAGSIALARAAVAAGTEVLVATPHIDATHGVSPLRLASRVAKLSAALRAEEVPLRVVPGGELAPSRALDLTEDELAAIGLGGSRCILLECPFIPADELMPRLVAHLQTQGLRVLLAHPERSPSFIKDSDRLEALVAAGALVQLTAGSLGGSFGRTVRRAALEMLDRGLVHVVASDAHGTNSRSPEVIPLVSAAVRERRLPQGLTAWLTHTAPRAILRDERLPPPPEPPPRRRRALSLWRR